LDRAAPPTANGTPADTPREDQQQQQERDAAAAAGVARGSRPLSMAFTSPGGTYRQPLRIASARSGAESPQQQQQQQQQQQAVESNEPQ